MKLQCTLILRHNTHFSILTATVKKVSSNEILRAGVIRHVFEYELFKHTHSKLGLMLLFHPKSRKISNSGVMHIHLYIAQPNEEKMPFAKSSSA